MSTNSCNLKYLIKLIMKDYQLIVGLAKSSSHFTVGWFFANSIVFYVFTRNRNNKILKGGQNFGGDFYILVFLFAHTNLTNLYNNRLYIYYIFFIRLYIWVWKKNNDVQFNLHLLIFEVNWKKTVVIRQKYIHGSCNIKSVGAVFMDNLDVQLSFVLGLCIYFRSCLLSCQRRCTLKFLTKTSSVISKFHTNHIDDIFNWD